MSIGCMWKPVEGFEGLYLVSDTGEIVSLPRNGKPGKTIRPSLMPNGYLLASLYKDGEYKGVGVHRIVAKAFCPNPLLKDQVNHLNGVRTDNRADNLQWVTSSENEEHKQSLLKTGNSAHPSVRKLSDEQVVAIRRSNKPGRELAREFGVSHSTIRNIKNRRIYKEID